MNKGDLKIERLQQYLDRQKGVVESNIKEYNQQLEKNYLYFFGWHADDLYKAYYMNQHYKAIQENLDNAETPQNIGEFLKDVFLIWKMISCRVNLLKEVPARCRT